MHDRSLEAMRATRLAVSRADLDEPATVVTTVDSDLTVDSVSVTTLAEKSVGSAGNVLARDVTVVLTLVDPDTGAV